MDLLPTELFIILSHYASGLWTRFVLFEFLICVPAVLLAVYLGKILNKKIPAQKFSKFIYILLLIISIVIFVDVFINISS